MTKKTKPPAKKAKNSGSMGRVLFYSVALLVAFSAVAVVLFETKAGQELVAKVRGKESVTSRATTHAKPEKTETKPSVGDIHKDGDDSKTAEHSESASQTQNSDNVVRSDTSAKSSDANEAKSSDSSNDIRENNDAQRESMAGDSVPETGSKNAEDSHVNTEHSQIDENTANMDSGESKEEWEKIDEQIDEDEPVEEEEKPVEEIDIPVVEMEKPDVEQDKPVEVSTEEHGKPEEPVLEEPEERQTEVGDGRFLEEGEMPEMEEEGEKMDGTEENAPEVKEQEEVNDGELPDEEIINVGDSLEELERERTTAKQKMREEKKQEEERYEPIPEPEGPPIDQSPVNARRGLRGDYGGKGKLL